MYRRPIDGTHRRWAARWWQHEEAIIRLEALWRAWEHLRLDPATGMSIWWRDHADHHMAALMSPDGPFAALSQSDPVNHSGPADPLPYITPPKDCSQTNAAPKSKEGRTQHAQTGRMTEKGPGWE